MVAPELTRRATSREPLPRNKSAIKPVLLIGLGLAALCAIGLTLPVLRPAFGLPDPGLAVRAGLPGARAMAELAAMLVVGALLAATFLIPDAADRARAMAAAARCSGWWAVLAAVMVPLTVADSLNRTLLDTLDPGVLVPAIGRLPVAIAWLVVAHVAALAWLGVKLGYRPHGLLVLALAGVTPVALTGHSSAGGDHDLASDSLMLHVGAASVWLGGLVAVLVLADARRDYAAVAVRRFSAIALGCWLVVAASGTVNAWLRVSPQELFGTRYGLLLLLKITALLALGGFGYLHRRRSLTALDGGRAALLLRLGGCEVLLMLATVGIAVGLGRTPAPAEAARQLSPTEVLVGYPLPDAPTLFRLATAWRFDLVFGTAAVIAAAWYLWRTRKAGWWLAGCAVLLVATSSGLGRYGPAVLGAQVAGQLLVAVAVPLLLVRDDPFTIPKVHPALAAGGALAVPVLLYVLGGFDVVAGQHWARPAATAWLLVAGLALFAHPNRRALIAVTLGYAGIGAVLLTRTSILGQSFLARLAVPWPRDLPGEQHLAGWLFLVAAAVTALGCVRARPATAM